MTFRPAFISIFLSLLQSISPTTAFQTFKSKIPNASHSIFGSTGIGHEGFNGGPRNAFGIAFNAAGRVWTPDLCKADSDGDGITNGEELGDPECKWIEGATPTCNTADPSHPGDASQAWACGGLSAAKKEEIIEKTKIAEAAAAAATSQYELFFILHSVCMVLAWGVFAPLGFYIHKKGHCLPGTKPGDKDHPSGPKFDYFHNHMYCMIVTILLTILGIIFAAINRQKPYSESGPHPIVGYAVLALALIQGTLGRIKKKGKGYVVSDEAKLATIGKTHRILGATIMSVGMFMLCTGSIMFNQMFGTWAWPATCMAVCGIAFLSYLATAYFVVPNKYDTSTLFSLLIRMVPN